MRQTLLSFVFLGLVVSSATPGLAQVGARAQISGTVVDSTDGEPLPGATILFTAQAPDSMRSGAAAGLDGRFSFSAARGSYRVRISFVGYEPVHRTVQLRGALNLGVIRLQPDGDALDEVEVAAVRQRVEIRGDTTAFNADAFPVNSDATAQDLITRLPGVVVENGTVTAQGETVQRVLVDGREIFGNDVQGALNTLPAEMIQEIQIFDRASEASQFSGFDDGNSEKTVNIVTRTGMQNGQFGRVYAGAGAEGEYLLGGNVSIMSGERRITVVGLANNVDLQNFSREDLTGTVASTGGGGGGRGGRGGGSSDVSSLLVPDQSGVNTTNAIGINYTDRLLGGKLQLAGSYVLNSTENNLSESLAREYATDNVTSRLYNESNAVNGTDTNHQASLRAQFNLTDRTQIVVQPRVSYQLTDSAGDLLGLTALPDGDALARSTTNSLIDASAISAQSSLLIRHSFPTPGRTLSLSVDGGVNDQNGENRQSYSLEDFLDSGSDDSLNQLFDINAGSESLGGSLGFTEQLSSRTRVQVNYRPQASWSSSSQNAFLADAQGAYSVVDSSFTSSFDQQSIVQRAGVSISLSPARSQGGPGESGPGERGPGERGAGPQGSGGRGQGGGGGRGRQGLNAQLGLDIQNEQLTGTQLGATSFDVDRSFWSILPSARLGYSTSDGKRVNLDYRVRTSTPSASQLQNVIDNSNPLLLSTGNPDLDPSTSHSLRARFNATDADGGSVIAGLLSGSYGVNAVGTQTTTADTEIEIAPGVILPAGAQLSQPINVDGQWDVRALVSYGRPIQFLGVNANASVGSTFSRSPGFINGVENVADQTGVDGRVFLGSAISPKFDFSLEYGARYTAAVNSASPSFDNEYVRHLAGAKLTWQPWDGLVFGGNLQGIHFTGLDESVDPTQVLLGAKLGYKFLQRDLAELSLSINDIFDQQRDVERTVTESYVEDAQTTALGRYVMLNLTYKLRNFGG